MTAKDRQFNPSKRHENRQNAPTPLLHHRFSLSLLSSKFPSMACIFASALRGWMKCISLSALRGWMKGFIGVDRVNFQPLGRDALFSLWDIPTRHETLWCAIHFWDPEVHVFQFGYAEVCPIVEEFQAFLEYRPRKSIVVPTIQVGP